MLTATLRRMLAHKLRLVLTTASIALGVAFLAGTLILTDTMGWPSTSSSARSPPAPTPSSARRPPTPQSEGIGTSRWPDRRQRPRPGQRRRRRPRRRGLGQRLRAAHRQRRQGHPHQGRRPDHGLQHAGRRDAPRRRRPALRRRAGAPERGRHRRHQRRGERHRARLDDQGPVPGSDPGVHRRRHRRLRRREGPRAAPRRRTSTPPPPSSCVGTPGIFDAIDVSAEDGVSQSELAKRLDAVVPDGTEAVTGATVAEGERRRRQEGPEDRGHPVHDLRRHRAVRRFASSSGTRSR